MNQENKSVTIAFLGRTGAGKSTVANHILGKEHFKVGHTLVSETESVASEICVWPLDPSLTVKLIDTPGFADNRPEMTNAAVLSKILDFLKNMQDGLNIAVYCLPAKARIDQHDTQELEMLGLLLGNAFFDHVCIAVTQVDTFMEENRLKIYENFRTYLPGIFLENCLPPVTEDQILFADFDNLKEAFMDPLTQKIQTTNSYIPELSREINTEDPESIRRFLATPEMKEMMYHYENSLTEQKREIEGMQQTIAQNAQEMQQRARIYDQEQANLQRTIQTVHQELSSSRVQSEKERKRLEELATQAERKLRDLRRDAENLNNQHNDLQRAMNDRNSQISSLNSQIVELNRRRMHETVVICDSYSHHGCNIF